MSENFNSYSDQELLKYMRGRNKAISDEAFKAIYSRYAPRVHAYCLKILNSREQAEDVFQETFIKFYQNVRADHEKDNIAGFLITIARNLCLNFKRDSKKTIPIEEFHSIQEENFSDNNDEILDLITSSIQLLEMEYKEPLILRLYDGLSYRDIAEVCQISEQNARKRVFRAKEKIRDLLRPYMKEIEN